MAEYSYFWGGTTVGDASLAPYSHDEFASVLGTLLTYDEKAQGVIRKANNPVNGNCEVTNPSGTTIHTDYGRAFINGYVYYGGGLDVDVNGLGTGYFIVVLQSYQSTQVVRQVIRGPYGSIPALTQNSGIWEIPLASFYFNDTSNTVSELTDTRSFMFERPKARTAWSQPLLNSAHHAGSADGSTSGGAIYLLQTDGVCVFGGSCIAPEDYFHSPEIAVVAQPGGTPASGNLYIADFDFWGATIGEQDTTYYSISAGTYAWAADSNYKLCVDSGVIDDSAHRVAPGDILMWSMELQRSHASDTLAQNILIHGARFSYVAID